MKNEPTIFYTDDDEDDREFFVDAIKDFEQSIQVTTQCSGDELLYSLKNPPPVPNIIFLDLNMPGKNGFMVLEELKSTEQTKKIPVIIFSTSHNKDAIEKCRELGADLYVTKPSTLMEYRKILNYCLTKNWSSNFSVENNFVYPCC